MRIIHERTGLPAVSIGAWRAAIAAVFVAMVLRRSGLGRAVQALRRRPWRLLLCGVGFGAYQALYFVGVEDVGVSVSTLVSLGIAPIALTIGVAVQRRAFPAPTSLLVLICAVIGLALISVGSPGASSSAPHPLYGVLASIGSGLGYAGITALSRGLSDVEPLIVTGVTSAIGAVGLLPLALAAGMAWPADGISSWWLVYIGIVPTVAAYWLFYSGLRTTSSEVAGVLTLLEPLTATLLAAVTVHETLRAAGIVGASLMLVAIAGLYLRGAEPDVVEAPPPP